MTIPTTGPDARTRQFTTIMADAAARAMRHVQAALARRITPRPEALHALMNLGGPLPDGPTDAAAVLAALDEIGAPATVASSVGRFFGFVTGGVFPVCLGATWLAAAWNQNAGLRIMSPVGAALEDIVLTWLVDLFGLPRGSGGALVTGATMANFSALGAARHSLLEREGWDVERQGLFGAPPIDVIVGDEVHASVLKVLSLLGLGRERVTRVPADAQGRLRVDRLPRLRPATIVCTQAGNVNTGAFDPVGEVCRIAREAGAWVHVDGAFGLWAAASPAYRHLTAGVAGANSWATDAHKWLNVGYDSGIVLVRDPAALHAAMSIGAAYYIDGERREPMYYTPESSRRARSIEVWAALRCLGRSGLAELVERCCHHAQRFAGGLRTAGFTVLNDLILNQVLVSFGDAENTKKVIAAIQDDGVCWCGGTVWQGHTAMRISVSDWFTSDREVDASLDAMIRLARTVS